MNSVLPKALDELSLRLRHRSWRRNQDQAAFEESAETEAVEASGGEILLLGDYHA